jgi:replicative DNA helicase
MKKINEIIEFFDPDSLSNSIDDCLQYWDWLLVTAFWKDPSLFREYKGEIRKKREINDIVDPDNNLLVTNYCKVLYNIGEDIVLSINKDVDVVLNKTTVEAYLKTHSQLKKIWDTLGEDPVEILAATYSNVETKNVEVYLRNIRKYRALKDLASKLRISVTGKELQKFKDIPLEDIYSYYEAKLNDIFANREIEISATNLFEGVEENIDKWDLGQAMGMPFYNLQNFSDFIGGIPRGGITLIGGISNVGKSSFLRTTVIPQLAKEKRKTIVFLNEEDKSKWQREIITWYANNKNNRDFQKNVIRDGGFKEDTKNSIGIIQEAIKIAQEELQNIKFIEMPKFSTDIVIKLIKKYSAMNYKTFIIDTFKMDNTDDAKVDSTTRIQLIQNMTKIYNICKPSVKNLTIVCTVQLSKASAYQRILTQDALAESKNMIDVCSTGVFMRNVWDDEKSGDEDPTNSTNSGRYPHWLKVYDFKNCLVKLQKDKKYLLLFPVKTREGDAGPDAKVTVCEVDWSRNMIKEIGMTTIPME